MTSQTSPAASFDVTIGWTASDRDSGYSSFDGYRPGAQQHTETVTVEWTNPPVGADAMSRTAELLAEAFFYATNAPRLNYPEGLTGQICRAMDYLFSTKVDGGDVEWPATHWSLSVGDTITVGEVTLACAPSGWEHVRLAPASA